MGMTKIFTVVADGTDVAGLSSQSNILAMLFDTVETGVISAPLQAGVSNVDFVRQSILQFICERFPNLAINQQQVQQVVQGFFEFDKNLIEFKKHLRDFLILSKEGQGDDVTDLYLMERQQRLEAARSAKQ